MTVETLLTDLSARDIVVTVAGDLIELDAPDGVLTDEDLVVLRDHKPDIIRQLRLAEGLPIDDDAARLLAMDLVAPADNPVCKSCGGLCDTQTADDVWHCSHCDPEVLTRRLRAECLLACKRAAMT